MAILSGNQLRAFEAMATVADLGDGISWKEFVDREQAMVATALTSTAVVSYFIKEGEAEDGRHPRRWFVLADETHLHPRAGVVLCVLPPGVDAKPISQMGDCHITGFQNGNPYPEFANEIAALADAIGVEIEPNWQGKPVEPAEAVRDMSPGPR